MLRRIPTILFGVPVILLCVYFGGIPFFLLALGLALLAVNEFYNILMKKGFSPAYYVGNLITLFFIVFAYYALKRNWEPAHSAILTLAAAAALIAGVFLKREKDTIVDIAITMLGMIYVGWFFSYLIFIRSLTAHGGYLFFLLFTVWAMDTAAYLTGRFIGRTPLFPSISPKKTWEGSIAGFTVCLLAAGVFSRTSNLEIWHALILGGLIGVFGQVSDLIESLIKRDAGVKDSSSLLPGHGGILDRIDSFILTAPLMYYYVVWFVLK
ncbi:phosphatidate cytidylyltransferase [Candidatus Saganbacteria bacterium]|uniref:Phosphatidate cytidylyltransferase n=1 Tax=Candidatus Saganbacteria bacterium TaxID=2575572 RepID=A0A9D6UMI0_UNCSA|nr:phosphatidate cytidylyltransferase [Candidatus Saganbacteria bacterium]